MRSRTAIWFECKVRYEKMMEDGMPKKVVELYTVDALSFSEAEERIMEEMSSYVSGEIEIADLKIAPYKEIFRKQFEKEADRMLSEVYDAEHMGASEKNFMASSQKVFAELMEVQQKLSGEANISNEKGQLIATQIIDKITEKKKKAVQKNGIQK